MKLRPNIPLDTHAIAQLIDDPDEMRLVWPKARWPFDHDQWRRVLDPGSGHHPFLIYEYNCAIGHAALRATPSPAIYTINYLYIKPICRNQGKGQTLMALLEKYAVDQLKASQLRLVVRTYNPRALACYQKCGYLADRQEGSLMHMTKFTGLEI